MVTVRMERLNFWRGLWRIWVIGTVAWAVMDVLERRTMPD